MDITHEELEISLYKIFTGKELTIINNGKKNINILYKQPSNDIKIEANFIYNKSYFDAINSGILPVSKLEDLIKERGLFTEEDQIELDNLNTKLQAQKVLLSKTTKVKANTNRIKKIITKIENEKIEITNKKNSRLVLSAETKAEEDRSLFLCQACSYDYRSGELYWNTYSDILKEINIEFKNNVLIRFLKFYNGIKTNIIRYIARSNLWRIRYVTSQKTSESLFGVPTSDYTNDMINLAYWSNYYQSVYEMLPEDRPPDLIIEDDDALDSYMRSYYEERNQEETARRSKRNTQGKLSAFDSEEVILTQSNELYEDVKYDTPREAQKIKGRIDVRKRSRRR